MKNILIGVGLSCLVLGGVKEVGKRPAEVLPETWLEEKMLTEVDEFQLIPKEFGSTITYKMSDVSYEVLEPIGIACQRMEDLQGRAIDVVIIAGHSMKSFHDQQICFKAQGWNMLTTEQRTMDTKSHGKIPYSFMSVSMRGELPKPAMYLFRTPLGFADYAGARMGFLQGKLKDPFATQVGYSYRFIGLTPDVSEDELRDFAADYLDKLDEQTKGVM